MKNSLLYLMAPCSFGLARGDRASFVTIERCGRCRTESGDLFALVPSKLRLPTANELLTGLEPTKP